MLYSLQLKIKIKFLPVKHLEGMKSTKSNYIQHLIVHTTKLLE